MKAVLFTNWTNEDFSYTWDKEPYNFPKGSSIMLQDYLANHFAKHLIDRELNKQGIPTNHFSRQEMLQKCFGEIITANTSAQLETDILNKKAETFCDSCDSKGVRHKKECPKSTRGLSQEEDSSEFPDLKS